MILNPSVIALVGGSATAALLVGGAAAQGAVILREWDPRSGSARQLELERRTVLVSTLVGLALLFELASLFLFVFAADALAPQFTGAMCAAGSLKANGWGYPVLLLRLLDAVLAGLWLILDRVDGRAETSPLLRAKYALLLALAPLVLLEAALQGAYFAGLRPEVITSCCGSLFGEGGAGVGSDLASLPPRLAAGLLFGTAGGGALAALLLRRTGRGAWLLGTLAAAALPFSLAGIVGWLSPYVYELPTHHCPFCLLQREYHHVGYALYGTLLLGSVAGTGAGVLSAFRRAPGLAGVLPAEQRRLAGAAALLLGAFALLAAALVLGSGLRS